LEVSDHWFDAAKCDLEDLIALCAQPTLIEDYPCASAIEQDTVVYDNGSLRDHIATPEGRLSAMAELADALLVGPGIVVFRDAFDPDVVEAVSDVFRMIIVDERARGVVREHWPVDELATRLTAH
jgi:hypothetical protein